MKRGVGYCNNDECEAFLSGVFLLNTGVFNCPSCREQGWIEEEKSIDWSERSDSDQNVYKTVRVHFDFDAFNNRYRHIALVYITELPRGETYEIYSPLIKTEKRALKVAECTLCTLNSGERDALTTELVLDMGRNDFYEQLRRLSGVLAARERRVFNALQRD